MKIVKLLLIFISFFMMLSSCQVEKTDINAGENNDDREKNPIIHIHSIGKEEIQNLIPATCEKDGSYDSVYHCTECDKELSRVTETIESEGHIPLDPVVEEEILNTCTVDGRRVTVTYCSVCEEEISREVEVLVSEGHVESEPVITYDSEYTCRAEGNCTVTIICEVCQDVVSSTTESVPMMDHVWVDGKCEKCNTPYSIEESLEFVLSKDETYYIVAGIGSCVDEKLVIPSEYKGLPVKEIANDAFRDCTFVVEATIPASITRLGYGAAFGCTSLKKLIFEDTSDWYLMSGFDATEGTKIPTFILNNPSIYIDQLIISNVLWMQKMPS